MLLGGSPKAGPLGRNMPSIDQVSAFVDPDYQQQPTGDQGSLAGLRFAVKDLFAMRGRRIGAGNPNWAVDQPLQTENAPIIDAVLGAGATLHGVTVLDEFAFSLIGSNKHFGVPINHRVPNHFCGGSSCGSASVVASGATDFALGTDTAGSMRIPAANCGLYAIRPSQRTVPTAGIAPLSPSFDTPGWFASSADVFQRVTSTLISAGDDAPLCISIDRVAVSNCAPQMADQVVATAEAASAYFDVPLQDLSLKPETITKLTSLFMQLEHFEAWQVYGEWAQSHQAKISTDVYDRLAKGADTTREHAADCNERLKKLAAGVSLPTAHHIFVRPTNTQPPLALTASESEKALFRQLTLRHTALIPALDWSELVMPLTAPVHSFPGGVSLCAAAGMEKSLASFIRSHTDNSA